MRLTIMQLGINMQTGTPSPGFLIQTDDGKNVVVDTGFGPEMVGRYRDAGGPAARVDESDLVTAQLEGLGVAPAEVDYVVVSHLDGDHAGFLSAFPGAEFVIQRAQYESATGGEARFARTQAQWSNPALRFRIVDGDTALLPGIELVESGGHVIGHQSVLVRLPHTGNVLLAVDAMALDPGDAAPDDYPVRSMDMNPEMLRASVRKLTDLIAREHVALVVYGHDPAAWKPLRKAPEYYD